MPYKPTRSCKVSTCPNKAGPSGYCPAHAPKHKPKDDRGSASSRGYDSRWQKARLAYLGEHPLCVECQREGRVEPATVVDHVVPHRGDSGLFWDSDNWQSLCKYHHDKKTAQGL